jgi:DNA-binding IclR family transcriptional regulator
MDTRPDWMHRADVAILDYLHAERLDYVPLVASHLGLHLSYAEARCETLAERGLVEPVSEEVVYRLTERGRALLEDTDEASAEPYEQSLTGEA